MDLGDLFEDAEPGESCPLPGMGRSKGKEIDEIPLCGQCAQETSREEAKDDHLIPMALRRIDRYDGGLSRRRWEEGMGGTRDDHGHETSSTLRRHLEPEDQIDTFRNSTGPRGHSGIRTPSPIYVSMRDPVGEPAFRRSETKPIPKWMQSPPGRRSDEMDCNKRPSSVLDDYFSPPDSSAAGFDAGPATRLSPSPPPVRAVVPEAHKTHSTPPQDLELPKRSRSPSRSRPGLPSTTARPATAFKAIQMSRPFTFIDEKPGQRPSSRLNFDRVSPSRHVHFISPPKTTRTSISPGSVDRIKPPSESSEYLDSHVPQAIQGRSPMLLPSSLRDGKLSLATPFVKRYARSPTRPSAKTALRSLGDQSSSTDLVHGSTAVEGVGPEQTHSRQYEFTSRGSFHGGGDDVADFAGQRRPGRVITFQDQLKRVFGFS